MKSNICKLTGKPGELKAVLDEVEKAAAYNGLEKRDTLRIRLLAEELVSMLPQLLDHAEGTFQVVNEGSAYELRVSLKSTSLIPVSREKLLGVSTTGKNAAATGIMGRIREAAEKLLTPAESFVPSGLPEDDIDTMTGDVWSLRHYVAEVYDRVEGEEKQENRDELERSIVAKIADDVKVGIRGRHVDIVVSKTV